MRSTVTKRSVSVLTGKAGSWKRVPGSANQIQRDIFVKVTVFENTGAVDARAESVGNSGAFGGGGGASSPSSSSGKYELRLHVHQPDMNIAMSKSVRVHELANILLPLFRGSVSKPMAQAIENAALLPEEDDDDDGEGAI